MLININAAIGAGIFALPALLYAGAGHFAPIAIIGFACAYACLAGVFAKLSTMFEQSGGPQLYAEHVFGRFTGFQIGWFVVCANFAGRAANFHVLVSYLAALFPVFGGEVARPVTVVSLIALATLASVVGTKTRDRCHVGRNCAQARADPAACGLWPCQQRLARCGRPCPISARWNRSFC